MLETLYFVWYFRQCSRAIIAYCGLAYKPTWTGLKWPSQNESPSALSVHDLKYIYISSIVDRFLVKAVSDTCSWVIPLAEWVIISIGHCLLYRCIDLCRRIALASDSHRGEIILLSSLCRRLVVSCISLSHDLWNKSYICLAYYKTETADGREALRIRAEAYLSDASMPWQPPWKSKKYFNYYFWLCDFYYENQQILLWK